jgi:hypothetical protein
MTIKTVIYDYKIEAESYINKPIIKDNIPIGTISKATKFDLGIEIEGQIWDKYISSFVEFTDDEDKRVCNSVSISL